ncbi:PAS domain-containing serine/threonine-protein kinase isoform X2 [Hermetia illucens]|uniref:PAS domain-containing serine/threonine-protein kinase isoform X2 n=1 Tax=Hermetia illucens TaxID=343691 RepID=UPI0018CC3EB8|nr:PAS domain-containing serine/threonine-protein kinase isoform X2 [Hermetia illucens]
MRKKFDNMDKIRVDGSNGLRFNLRRIKGCFTPAAGSPFNASIITSASDCLMRVPKSGINPNKAVFTMDSRTSQILIVNNNACQLLGYSSRELCSMQFSDLLTNKNKSHVCALAEGQLNSEDGTMVLLSGKVVEMNTKSNTKVAVSLWIRQIDQDGRCLAVAEPVERRVCQFVVDKNGIITSATTDALMIFQFESLHQFIDMEISVIIPAITLPDADNSVISKQVRKQKATGKTSDGISFPLCLLISHHDPESDTNDSGLSNANSGLYLITVWVFQNISGLIVIDEYGVIESCNHHFSMLMFGYAQSKILNQHITKLIPNFGQELEYLGMTRSRNATESSLDNESVTETDPICEKSFPKTEPEVRKVIQRPVSESIRHSIDFTKLDSDIIGSENSIEKLLTAQSMAEKANFIRGGGGSLSSSDQQSNLLKSVSADILTRENVENNKNAANIKNKTGNAVERRNSMMISEAIESTPDAGNVNENDLLTPVNDASNQYSISANLTPNNLEYNSSDIAAGLVSVGSFEDESKSNVGPTTPNFSESLPKCELESGLAALTSTPDVLCEPKLISYSDGKYKGEAIHSDGNVLDILYTISCQTLPCGRKAYCVWICRDPDTVYDLDDDIRHQNLTLTFNSITSTIENSLGQAIKNTAAQNCSRPNSVSLMSQFEDEEQISGEFSKYYTTLRQIGKGAYGYVKLAYRNSDHLLVVAKFILKEKLCPQQMILTEDKKEIPMEIYLLTTLKHPNIVTVYDVFENEKFFQLVMEKHGCGMDLFEFIDRRPMIDEKLGCFIFRQIANAVNYLHSLNVLHRDIKDENIIIDQNFHVKLIDFGSATFMEEGKLFSTFFGTTEYCSPEVLAGNKYAGPELEMWSLGVTLYVLMFFENPFLDVEETLRSELIMPHKVSANLENLLFSMLDKNPRTRCTMRQLMAHPWVNQEINPAVFDFAWTIPCDPLEANPEKYFSEQPMYSSATALSTTSPQDSLSLVDEDSMIDGDEVADDDKEEKINGQSRDDCFVYDKCDKSSSVQQQNIESSISSQLTSQMSAMAIDTSVESQHSQPHKSLMVHRRSSQRQHQPIQLHYQPPPSNPVETTTAGSKTAVDMSQSSPITTTSCSLLATIQKSNDCDITTMMTPTITTTTTPTTTTTTTTTTDEKANTSYEILSIEYNNEETYDEDSWDEDYDDEEDDGNNVYKDEDDDDQFDDAEDSYS